MSAYLSRIVQRFSPPASDDGSVALRPFIRSRSPIAAIDQRLGIDESLGHGLGDLGGGGLEAPSDDSPSSEPERVQRKAATPSATAATLPAPSPAPMTPAANLSPMSPLPASPTPAGPVPTIGAPASVSPAAPSVDAPGQRAELAPRREPMDPGPLFGPFALHHDEARNPEVLAPPSAPDLRTLERIIERRESTNSPSAPVIVTSMPARPPSSSAAAPMIPAPRPQPAVAPWVAFDRNTAAPALPNPTTAPIVEPRPAARPQVELRIVPLVVEPRQSEPVPFVPDAEPAQSIAQTQTSQSPAPRERVEATQKPKPTVQVPVTPTPARGRLTIDSISQIGPLARHFPNRRHLRLRYL